MLVCASLIWRSSRSIVAFRLARAAGQLPGGTGLSTSAGACSKSRWRIAASNRLNERWSVSCCCSSMASRRDCRLKQAQRHKQRNRQCQHYSELQVSTPHAFIPPWGASACATKCAGLHRRRERSSESGRYSGSWREAPG